MNSRSFEIEGVVERLERLEKQNQQLRRAISLAIVLIASTALIAAAPRRGRVIQASEFLLRDSDGNVRAALRMGTAGPDLVFYGEDGKAARLLLGVLSSGPALGLYDSGGKTRISLSVSKNGANLIFNDTDEKLRAEFGMLEDGPNLMLLNTDGLPIYKAYKAR